MQSIEVSDEIKQRYLVKGDFTTFAAKCLDIRTKAGEITPLILNSAQLYLHDKLEQQRHRTGKVRALVLKGRQQGISTYIAGRYYHISTHAVGKRVFILTHSRPATDNLFSMVSRYQENNPYSPTLAVDNARGLVFEGLDSDYKIGTAGAKAVGRSDTIQLFHGSEVAFWENSDEHAAGILQAVPDADGTEIILESTANGMGNFFHKKCMEAIHDDDWELVFIPWFWDTGYTKEVKEPLILTDEEIELKKQYEINDGQILWRRRKILDLRGELLFKQEYPFNITEAFQQSGHESFISVESVMAARNFTVTHPYGEKVLGCDPAWEGDDRTSFCFRQGTKVHKVWSFAKTQPMEVVGECIRVFKEEGISRIFIDSIGVGAGIYSRLCEELGSDKIVSVNSAAASLWPQRYANKRAEMWDKAKEYLTIDDTSLNVDLPDMDSLQTDLTAPALMLPDSKGRLIIQSNKDIKKNGHKSPDEGTSFVVTFAEPSLNKSSSKLNYPDIGIV